jgi:hypothetical protein
VAARNEPHQELLSSLARDAEDRAAEAQSLMDAAEYRSCSPQARRELLRDTHALLMHAPTQPPTVVRAKERLRGLLPDAAE